MKLPKHTLAKLEDFWAREYESDYQRFIEIEELPKGSAGTSSNRKEMAAISTV